MSLHYFNKEKTIKIFNNICKILEKDGILIGRVNSDKNGYINDNCIEIEKDFYYDKSIDQHKRLFNKEQFDMLLKNWSIVLLNENETVRRGYKKYTWEFILKK